MRQFTLAAIGVAVVGLIGVGGIGAASAAGALATGACGAYGQAFGFRDIDAAQNSALQQCNGPGCRVVATLRRSCAALAVDVRDPCGTHAAAHAPRLGIAQNDALRRCYRSGGKECVIRTFVCDGKGRG
jgi:hypothetical protein